MSIKSPKADTNFKVRQSVLGKVATNIVDSMGSAVGLVNFPTPAVALTDIEAAIDTYETNLALASKGSKTATENKNTSKLALINLLRTQAIYVTQTALTTVGLTKQTNASVAAMRAFILTSGFKVSKKPNPVADKVGIDYPIVKKAVSKTAGTLHLLLRQYTRFKKGTKVWQLMYRVAASGETPAGPWFTVVSTSGNINATGITPGLTDWTVGAIGGRNAKLNEPNPVNFTPIRQIVII